MPEVWEWRPSTKALVGHRLVGDRYHVRDRSDVLPSIDLVELARFVQPGENQTRLAKAYQTALRV